MKKLFLMGFTALAFASCVSDKEITPLTQGEKYEKAFENLVGGTVNANVNWGFNNLQVAGFDADGNFTGMRGANTEANNYGKFIEVPTEMSAEQKAKVMKYFENVKNPQGIAVNWSDFFVHQVGNSPKGDSQLDYLICGNGTDIEDHINNFNSGSSTSKKNVGLPNPNDANNCIQVDYTDGIMLVQNSSTGYFGFHNSYDNTVYKDNFVMIPGELIDALYPEAPSVAGMWFVGFDYEHDKNKMGENDVEERDFYFNDWVIRVSPGYYRYGQRIMVEDLIAQNLDQVNLSDWDFNDAVFDVAYVDQYVDGDNHLFAKITLWAAGGTQALTVAGKEVHELFGQPVSAMINTGNGVDGLAPVIFSIKLGKSDWQKHTADEIKVMVGTTELKAETGKAPQKIAVPTTTKWMKERQIITKGYADFKTYATTDQPEDWYNTVTDASVLY